MTETEKESKIRESQRQWWEQSWGDDNFSPAWKGRGVSPEIVQLIEKGWLPKQGSVLDIGCGEGAISEWFSQEGYDTVGIDISKSVIDQAISQRITSKNKHLLQFIPLDITEASPPDKQYDIIIDRGCLHAIHPSLVKNYVNNIIKVTPPTVKLLLYIRAFRNDIPFNDTKEIQKHNAYIKKVFDGFFEIKAYKTTNIGKTFGAEDSKWLPGIVYLIERVQG